MQVSNTSSAQTVEFRPTPQPRYCLVRFHEPMSTSGQLSIESSTDCATLEQTIPLINRGGTFGLIDRTRPEDDLAIAMFRHPSLFRLKPVVGSRSSSRGKGLTETPVLPMDLERLLRYIDRYPTDGFCEPDPEEITPAMLGLGR